MEAVSVLNIYEWSLGQALQQYNHDPVHVYYEAMQRFLPIKREVTARITAFRQALVRYSITHGRQNHL